MKLQLLIALEVDLQIVYAIINKLISIQQTNRKKIHNRSFTINYKDHWQLMNLLKAKKYTYSFLNNLRKL